MDLRHHAASFDFRTAHIISVSQTTCPSTSARPVNLAMPRFARPISASRRSWSPGDHGLLEAGRVDAREVEERPVAFLRLQRHEGEDRAGLRQRLDDQHARHHRMAREVAHEERLVDRDVLQRDDALARHELEHAVDEDDRIAVRQLPHDLLDVHLHDCFPCRSRDSSCRSRSRRSSSLRMMTATRSQSRFFMRGKKPRVVTRLREGTDHQRRGADRAAVGDREVAGDHRRAADLAAASDARAAGDADAAGDHRVRADDAVVRDLDLVVELDAVLDHGVAHRAAVDRRVGADLDVVADHDAADLGDLDPAAVERREAEAVGADDGAARDDAALAQPAAVEDDGARVQARARPRRRRPHRPPRPPRCARPRPTTARSPMNAPASTHAVAVHPGRGRDRRGGRHARPHRLGGMQQLGRVRKPRIRLVDDDEHGQRPPPAADSCRALSGDSTTAAARVVSASLR